MNTDIPVSPVPLDGAAGVPVLVGVDPDPLNYTSLQVSVSDGDHDPLTVSFYGRRACQEKPFTLVALPDTQYYTDGPEDPYYWLGGSPEDFYSQMNWIVNNRNARNIVYTTHMGDIVDNGSITRQWDVADAAYDILDVAGMKYGMAIGNHDGAFTGDTTNFNMYFPTTPMLRGGDGYYSGDPDNRYSLFRAGSQDFIIIHLEWNVSPATLEWANTLLQTYNTHLAIVVTHHLLEGTTIPAPFTSFGQAIYNKLKGNANLFLMLGGHSDGSVSRVDTYNGHTVYSLRSDYQGEVDGGGGGYLRLMEFHPADNQIQVYTYSPVLDQWMTRDHNQFTLPYDVTGMVCQFELIQTLTGVPSGSSPMVKWGNRALNATYEWYVVVNDGGSSVQSPVWSFTTSETLTTAKLVSFNAIPGKGKVELNWETGNEADLLGFNIYRALAVGGEKVKFNPELIPASNSGKMTGSKYSYQDLTTQSGEYSYWLELVKRNENVLSQSLQVRLGFWVYMPFLFR